MSDDKLVDRLLNDEVRQNVRDGADPLCVQAAAAIKRLLSERASMEGEIERLKDHIFGQAEFAEYRIKDGVELGANVWRIALEDIAKENRAALTSSKTGDE